MNTCLNLIKSAALVLAAGVVLLPTAARAAGDAKAEATAAATHAGLASKATTVMMVHTHLHHAINCLVGPKGKGFDAMEENPCAKMGDGAIPDTTSAAELQTLKAAVAEAENGIKSNKLAASQDLANDVSVILKASR